MDKMAQANLGVLIRLQEHWQKCDGIPRWKKDGMIALTNKLKRRLADNRNELDGVELYFPEDCDNYDVFMTVAYALDAFVVPSGNGCTMRKFGEHPLELSVE